MKSQLDSQIDCIVFDLGGVLVDWNPRHLFKKLIADEVERERFLASVCNSSWNEKHDAGYPLARGTAELVAKFPQSEFLIRAYFDRWTEMVAGEIPGTAEILKELHNKGRYKIFALSNWSAETFPYALQRFEFFKYFDDILISGKEKLIKPDPRFFNLLNSRHAVDPKRSVFIDDIEKNIDAAKVLGFNGILFTDAESLRKNLNRLGMLFTG